MKARKHRQSHKPVETPPHFIAAVAIAMFLILLVWVATFRLDKNNEQETLFSIIRGAGEQVRSVFRNTNTAEPDDARVEELRKRVFPEFQ